VVVVVRPRASDFAAVASVAVLRFPTSTHIRSRVRCGFWCHSRTAGCACAVS